jgi:hypothetical protein
MAQRIEAFYCQLKDFHGRINRIRSKTVSTQEFKKEATEIYETWMTEILPILRKLKLKDDVYTHLDELFEIMNWEAKERVSNVRYFKQNLSETINTFFEDAILKVREIESPEPTADLMDSASFIGLDTNWSVATCALQLQEVAITLVAKQKNIKLDKKHVERMLNKKIDYFSFNEQYEAFSREIKRLYDVDMPFLTTQFRKIRVKILHEGYNPEPEEKDSIVSFTLGLLQKLKDISDKEPLESEH